MPVLLLVGLGWLYVVVMMAAAEATSPHGSVLGAIVTLVLYGLGPMALAMYLLATPARRRRRRALERAAAEAAEAADARAADAAGGPPPPGGPQ